MMKAAELMPGTAEIVRDLRAWLGTAWVDGAMAASQQARREHRRLEALHGRDHADAWLKRQRWPAGRFHAVECGREVGVALP